MGNCIKLRVFEARKYSIWKKVFINSHNCKAKGCTLSAIAMMFYVSGIDERFNSDIDKIYYKNQYIYQSTYSIKDI